jgi:hypothetical protein
MDNTIDPRASVETDLAVGPQAIANYSRLSYTMWHALAEFIDNSTQSRLNHGSIIDEILKQEGVPLKIEITHNRIAKTITIEDNSIGMTRQDLIHALQIGVPTVNSKGRSKYGMGMKTSACWIGRIWRIETVEWGSGVRWSATIDVEAVCRGEKVTLSSSDADTNDHGTKIIISELHRNVQKRTEGTIQNYLGSMYRFDLGGGQTKILYNGTEIPAIDNYDIDSDPTGKPMKLELPSGKTINGKPISGWVAVLKKGGRKFGGFSLFQNERQIQGYPNAWKPRAIFGGEDDEGANNLIAQRLTGLLNLDGFKVSHTKDAILFEDDEEAELEAYLKEFTKDYRDYANKRRGPRTTTWSRDKIRELMDDMKKELSTPEFKDAVSNALLPPIEIIQSSNQKQLEQISDADHVGTFDVSPELKVCVWLQETSVYEPYVTLVADARPGTMHVIVNGLHPYYTSLQVNESIEECIRQFVYDAIAEYRVSKMSARVSWDSVRTFKNDLLKAQIVRVENRAARAQDGDDLDTGPAQEPIASGDAEGE